MGIATSYMVVLGTWEAKQSDSTACCELVAHLSHREIAFSQTAVIFQTSHGSFSGLLSSQKLILDLGRFGSLGRIIFDFEALG